MTSLKKRTITAILWDLAGSLANKGVGFVISIFLARILTPEEFGLIGMVMAFVAVSSVLLDVGLGSALIQRKEVQDLDYSSVLLLNAGVGIFLTLIMYSGSEMIGAFYNNESIPGLSRWLCWMFLINSLGIIPKNKLTKELRFKSLTRASFIASLASGTVGVVMAFNGYGVWSLVVHILLSGALNVILLWSSVKWFPGWSFEFARVKSLWGFGFNIFLSSFLNSIVSKMDIIVIGKLFSPAQLGYYTRALSITNLIDTYSGRSTSRVLFPALSEIQNNIPKLVKVYEKTLMIYSFISFSLIGLLFITAEPFIILIFTVKWSASIPFLKIMLLRSFVTPLSALSISTLKALGRSRDCLVAEIMKKSLYILAVIIGFSFGITEFLYALLVQGIMALCINFYYLGAAIKMKFFRQVRIIFPYALYAATITFTLVIIREQLQISMVLDLMMSSLAFLLLLVLVLKATGNKAYSLLYREIRVHFSNV